MSKRLNKFLDSLVRHDIHGKVHVNGVNHLNAVLVVDFTQPFHTIGLQDALFYQTVEQVRDATLEYFGNKVNRNSIVVEADAREGIIYSRYVN